MYTRNLIYLIPSWQTLSKLGRNRFFKTSYFWLFFVPITVKLLSKLNSTLNFNVLGEKIRLHFELPFSWQVFFLTAVAFSIGNLIYSLRCPEIIQDYKDGNDYEKIGQSDRKLYLDISNFILKWTANSRLQRLISETQMMHFVRRNLMHPGNKTTLDIGEEELMREGLQLSEAAVRVKTFTFWDFRALVDYIYPSARLLVASLYGMGLLFVGVLVIQNIRFVLTFIWNSY